MGVASHVGGISFSKIFTSSLQHLAVQYFINDKEKVMKIKTLMVINAVITVVFGLAFVFMPERLLLMYGNPVDAPMLYLGQLFGATHIMIAVLMWSARNVADSEARKAIVLAVLIGYAIAFIVALIAQFNGVVNALGWLTVAIYFFFSLGFGYFHFKK